MDSLTNRCCCHVRPGDTITVTAMVLWNSSGHVLTVRKAGTAAFMLPGGKIEEGETPRDAGVREVAEEVGLILDPAKVVSVGEYHTAAANEPGVSLMAFVFAYTEPVEGERVASEIAQARWLDPEQPGDDEAPLTLALLHVLRDRD